MKIVNLKEGMPLVHQALAQLSQELVVARDEGYSLVKLIHGYGSTGAGGEIRIAVQKRLREMSDGGQIRRYYDDRSRANLIRPDPTVPLDDPPF